MGAGILLVRHGQSTWNAEHRWAGHADPPLSASGQPDGSVVPKMRRLPSDGELPAEVVLSSSPRRADTPAVAFDREGDAVVAWANDNVVQARTLAASGALGELETVSGDVSPIDRHSRARVTIDRDGDALVTRPRHVVRAPPHGGRRRRRRRRRGLAGRGHRQLHGKRARPQGDPGRSVRGPEQVVVTKGVSPTVAVAPTGGALLTWERRFQVDLRAQVSDDLS